VNKLKKSLVWFRRDLRLYDHVALYHALKSSDQVYCSFIFDTNIIDKLEDKEDRRIDFIWSSLEEIKTELKKLNSDLIITLGDPLVIIPKIIKKFNCDALFFNKDYESYAISRDNMVIQVLKKINIKTYKFKDQVMFEEQEILTKLDKPYTIFTPYRNNHLNKLETEGISIFNCEKYKKNLAIFRYDEEINLSTIGFKKTNLENLNIPIGSSGGKKLLEDFKSRIDNYDSKRNFPSIKGVSYLSVHNRFGTISIRHLAKIAIEKNSKGSSTWLNELIWRDFYFQILSNFPYISEGAAFKRKYNDLKFENDEKKFLAWKEGKTGFPIIDAAMRQLNQTGFMHNRLRMITACFLIKDLLIDWRWGETYFADKLIDFDFSANNGGWQWAASTGCDAQPWFRIFNPILQSEKFDSDGKFIKKYIPELRLLNKKTIHAPWLYFEKNKSAFPIILGEEYPLPIIDHSIQRNKTLEIYKKIK